MRPITLTDVQDTFLQETGDGAIELVEAEEGMAIATMLTNAEQLEAMGLDELDQLRVTVMVFGAFTAGVFTAKRVIEAGQ